MTFMHNLGLEKHKNIIIIFVYIFLNQKFCFPPFKGECWILFQISLLDLACLDSDERFQISNQFLSCVNSFQIWFFLDV